MKKTFTDQCRPLSFLEVYRELQVFLYSANIDEYIARFKGWLKFYGADYDEICNKKDYQNM